MAAIWRSLRKFQPTFELCTGILIGVSVTKVYYEVTGAEKFLARESTHKEQDRKVIDAYDNLRVDYNKRLVIREEDDEDEPDLDIVDGRKFSRSSDAVAKYGLPQSSTNILRFKNHVLCFDQAKRIPLWACHHLTREKVNGEADRAHSRFRADPQVPAMFQSQNEDYWDSRWSRGHMIPASDCKYDQEAMDDSFFLSNIVPQNYDNNANFWYKMEVYCRSLTKRYSDVYVISGPLFVPEERDEGKHVNYQVIGESNVAVPTHLFKIILAEDTHKPSSLGVFVVPNAPIPEENKLQDYQVSLGTLENMSGIQFLNKLDLGRTVDICEYDGCKLLSTEIMEKIRIGRTLRNATSLESVNKIWDDVKAKGFNSDEILLGTFEKKTKEFELSEKGS